MVQIKYFSGGAVSTRDVDANVFGDRVLGRMLKEAIVMYEANKRAGTAKTKERGEVKGPNKKPWKQKHTGRARAGTSKSPLWTGGGRIFGPRPRDYEYHIPIKERRLALASALLSKFRDGEVTVVEGLPKDKPSTKSAVGVLAAAGVVTSALVVTEATDRNLYLSLRNVPGITVRPQLELNALEVLKRRNLVLTPPALDSLLARFQQLGLGHHDRDAGVDAGAVQGATGQRTKGSRAKGSRTTTGSRAKGSRTTGGKAGARKVRRVRPAAAGTERGE